MVGIFLREFNCTHCGQIFTIEEGDLILPGPRLCDNCLKRLWHLTDQELVGENIREDNLQLLRDYKQHYQLDDLIELREQTRQRYA